MDTYTGYIVAGPERPPLEAFAGLIQSLWRLELVRPRAALSVGTVVDQREVISLEDPGRERTNVWVGTSCEDLLAAAHASWTSDLAVCFPAVTPRAFARPRPDGSPPVPGDNAWDHPGTLAPSLCIYAVTRPIKVARSTRVPGAGKSLGRSCAWAALDGPGMGVLREYLHDTQICARMRASLGKLKVGDEAW